MELEINDLNVKPVTESACFINSACFIESTCFINSACFISGN